MYLLKSGLLLDSLDEMIFLHSDVHSYTLSVFFVFFSSSDWLNTLSTSFRIGQTYYFKIT